MFVSVSYNRDFTFRCKEEPLSDVNFPSMDESEDGTDNEQGLTIDSKCINLPNPFLFNDLYVNKKTCCIVNILDHGTR